MISTNYYVTFQTLLGAEYPYKCAAAEKNECVIWIKQEKGERFLEVSRVKSIWEKIKTIGFVNTVKSWFGLGEASLRGVFSFLNTSDVKSELKRQYLELTHTIDVTNFDTIISRLNSDARRQNLPEFTLGVTSEEKSQLAINISQIEAKRAEENRKYQEIRQKEDEEKRRQEEAKRKLEADSTPPSHLASILAPFPNPARSFSGVTSHVSMSQTINGRTTSYSGTFNGSCDVRMNNGKVTVHGTLV